MTITQIEYCLEEIGGYTTNMDIPLNEVSSIVLNVDQVLYPGKKMKFNFKTTENSELLLVYEGFENENGDIIFNKIPNYFISFSAIFGFNLKSHIRVAEPYKLGMAV